VKADDAMYFAPEPTVEKAQVVKVSQYPGVTAVDGVSPAAKVVIDTIKKRATKTKPAKYFLSI
jgi:hypothetical protein